MLLVPDKRIYSIRPFVVDRVSLGGRSVGRQRNSVSRETVIARDMPKLYYNCFLL